MMKSYPFCLEVVCCCDMVGVLILGMPKGAILTQGAYVSNVAAIYKHSVSCVYIYIKFLWIIEGCMFL